MSRNSKPLKMPKRPSLTDAHARARSLRAESGRTRALRRCAQECALARRARSRKRFAYWTEVARIVEDSLAVAAPAAPDRAETAQSIAQLAAPLVGVAGNAGYLQIARLLAIASAHAAQVAARTET